MKTFDCFQCWRDSGELMRPFIVCPTCGNKRCPKATSHKHECSGSNEAGQEGSIYGNYNPNPGVLEGDMR